MLNILPKLELKFEKKITLTIENLNRKYSNLGFYYIFGLIKGLKDLADPPNLSPEIRATETLTKSPETAETMASLLFLYYFFCQKASQLVLPMMTELNFILIFKNRGCNLN